MTTSTEIMLAFASGVFGTVIGGTPAFVFCSAFAILTQILTYAGVNTAAMELYGSNLFLLPAVCFTGGAAAAAMGAYRGHKISGTDTWSSLAPFNDPILLLTGGAAAIIGYYIFKAAVVLHIPCDQGALSVLLGGILIRLALSTGRKYEPNAPRILAKIPGNVWFTHILMAGALSAGIGLFAELSGFWSLGFGLSGVSLLFCMIEPNFPATHHITLVAGYAMQMTHNLVIAVIFGIISELLCYIFAVCFNNKCSTHVDPPAFAILLCSLFLFTVF